MMYVAIISGTEQFLEHIFLSRSPSRAKSPLKTGHTYVIDCGRIIGKREHMGAHNNVKSRAYAFLRPFLSKVLLFDDISRHRDLKVGKCLLIRISMNKLNSALSGCI